MINIHKILLEKKQTYKTYSLKTDKPFDSILDEIGGDIKNGLQIVGLHNIDFTQREFFNFANIVRELTGMFDVLLFVFEQIEISKLISADGIVLNKNTLNISEVKKLAEDRFAIGYFADKSNDILYAKENYYDFVITDLKNENIDIIQFSEFKG